MAYRFTSGRVEFAIAPINLATFGPVTCAVFLKRNTAGTQQFFLAVNNSTGATSRIVFRFAAANTLEFLSTISIASTQVLSSTSLWYLVAVTLASGTSTPRFHVHDGTSWVHADGGGTSTGITLSSGDRLTVGARGDGIAPVSADIVCAGIKKAASNDATIETLTPTAFQNWRDFGFDWLIGFDTSLQSAGVLQDQATPGTGDEIAKTGTSVVSNPPGWAWTGGGVVAPKSGFLAFT